MARDRPYDGPALLHVGYPKTATTYLQHKVFSDPALGFSLAGGAENRSHLMKWFRTDDQFLFDPTIVSRAMDALEEPIRADGLVPVWSEEILIGNPLTRHYDGAWTLQKLRSLDRPFKALLTIRRQTDLCLSAYREYLHLNRLGLTDFIGTGNEPRSFQPILAPDYLRFDVAAKKYIEAFRVENVVVLPQELLKARPDEFLYRITSVFDLPQVPAPPAGHVNVGMGGTALLSSRLLNALFVRSPLGQDRSFGEKVAGKAKRAIDRLSPDRLDRAIEGRWRAQIETRYATLFAGSNRKLQSLIDIDLNELGYV